jgi:cell wall-associated NlpC family hydrolase
VPTWCCAAEAYNGALTRAQHAGVARDQARAAATTAQQLLSRATATATTARVVAAAATERAQQALAAQQAAEQQVADAQLALNRMAFGAFSSGGQLGMVSQLFVASDPLELANGRNLINQVGAYQQKVVVTLHRAQEAASTAAARATRTQAAANQAADQASEALTRADEARRAATQASRAASAAAAAAGHALFLASKAKATALVMVSRAQAALGSAAQQAAHLEAAAAAARRAARASRSGPAPSNAAATAIHWAYQEIGIPYSWGGGDENGPTRGFAQGANTVGFDCSGLTLFVYGKSGIHLDHYTGSQWNQGKRISSRADLQPGDLMFFATDPSNEATIHHVALYIGNGQMIEAPYTGEVVRVSSADRSDFIGGTRPWA